MYCLEYLERNTDWLEERLARFPGAYFLFDCPGQAELVTHHTALQRIAHRLLKLDYRVGGLGGGGGSSDGRGAWSLPRV